MCLHTISLSRTIDYSGSILLNIWRKIDLLVNRTMNQGQHAVYWPTIKLFRFRTKRITLHSFTISSL